MENSKKKIGSIVLTVYLTLVTIGCALFGYLYFSSKKGGSGMSISSAQQLVNMVCYDLGLIEQNPREDKTTSGQASATSLDEYFQDATKKELEESLTVATFSYSIGLFNSKALLEGGFEQNKYYFSKTIKQDAMLAEDFMLASHIYITYKIQKNSFICDFVRVQGKKDSAGNYVETNNGRDFNHIEISYTSNKAWEMQYYMLPLPSNWDKAESINSKDAPNEIYHTFAAGDENGITNFQSTFLATSVINPSEKIADAKEAKLSTGIESINFQKGKYMQASFNWSSQNNNLKAEDAIQHANSIRSKANSLKLSSFQNMSESTSTTLLDNVTSNLKEYAERLGLFEIV